MATKSTFCTKIKRVEHEALWTIGDFPTLVKTMANSRSIKSPEFEIQVTGNDGEPVTARWYLCYPASSGYVALYICLENFYDLKVSLTANVQFNTGSTCRSLTFTGTTDFVPCWLSFGGVDKYLSHAQLTTNPQKYLTNHTDFVIRCQITISQADASATSLDRLGWENLAWTCWNGPRAVSRGRIFKDFRNLASIPWN